MATVTQWTPFGVALDITATSGTVTRKTATTFTVVLNVSWETYYSGAKTNYGMSATSGGVTKTISAFDGTKRSSGSASFTGTYSISGNGAATKTITVSFKNFNTDNGDSATKSINLSVSVPAWTSYTVTFNANGGSGAPSAQTKWKDQTLTLSSTKPTRSGYTFVGWGTSTTDTTADYSAGGKYTANAADTLYAIWKKTITLTYSPNGGSGAPGTQKADIYNATTSYKFTLSSTKPTRSGYTFLGWSTSSSATSASYSAGGSITLSANDTLYAIWSKKITLTYSANGGSNAPSAESATIYNATTSYKFTISSTKPSRSGYTFLGWSTNSSATSATYSAGSSITLSANDTLYAVWKTAYVEPKITSLTVKRCALDPEDGSNIYTDEGTYAYIEVGYTTFNTAPTITIAWQSSDNTITGSVEIPQVETVSGSGINAVTVGAGALSADLSFKFTVTVSDGTSSVSKSASIYGLDFPIEAIHENGKYGVAIGKAAEVTGLLDIAYETTHHNPINFDNDCTIRGTYPDGETAAVFYPINRNGETLLGYGQYTRNKGETKIYGKDVQIGVSNIPTPALHRPYRRKGDTISIVFRTAGYVTNSGKDVSFWLPMAMPIIGSPTATAADNEGFVLRQGNLYTHGSSASVLVKAASLEATATYANGIYIKAVFNNATNVTNNDAIGIYWSGTITLS